MNQHESLPARIEALPTTGGPMSAHRLEAPGCEVLFLRAPAGSGCPPHEHDTENATVIISGGMVLITEDGEEQRFGPGDWYQTNPGQTHAIRFEVDTVQIELRFDP